MRALPVAVLALTATPVRTAARAQAPATPRVTVAANPVAPFLGVYSAEVEAALGGRGFTAGAGGTYDTDRENMSWFEGKLLYYVGRTPLTGISLGITAGVAGTLGPVGPGCGGVPPRGCERSTETAPLAGALVGYDLRFGPGRRVVLGAGLGVQRIFLGDPGATRLREVAPDGRLVVGWAF